VILVISPQALASKEVMIEQLKNKVTLVEDHSKKYNLIISGIPENNKEDCGEIVQDFLSNKMKISNVDCIGIDMTHRLRN